LVANCALVAFRFFSGWLEDLYRDRKPCVELLDTLAAKMLALSC
jgi:hypothetical protein